ncbi:MAG TPA: GAF domain-containing protein [Candidatus Binatia bacterium]|nr:GAF domain-containing protein [Candidatus Binatia bacterium]
MNPEPPGQPPSSDETAPRPSTERPRPRVDAWLVFGTLLFLGSAAVWTWVGAPKAAPAWPLTVPLALVGAAIIGARLAAQVSAERASAERLTRHHADRLATVLRIAARLASSFDRGAILQTIVTETRRVLGVDATSIRILEGDRLDLVAWSGMSDEVAARLPAITSTEGRFGVVLRTGQPWIRDKIDPTEPGAGYERYRGVLEFAADIAVPLTLHEKVIGVLTAVSNRPRHWTASDVEFLTALAGHAAIALENADLFARTNKRAAELEVLRAASARLSRENTLESVGRAIVEETRRIIDYHNARVYLVEPPDDVVPIAFEGRVGAYEQVDLALLRTKLGVGFTGWVALTGTPLVVPDANADPRGATIPGTDEVDESMLVVPMRYDERTIGVITLSKLGLGQFDEEDLRLLSILADHAATAVESVRLLERTGRLARDLQRIVDMSRDLARSLEPRAVADAMARHLAGAAEMEGCVISAWDRQRNRLLTFGVYPPNREVGAEFSLAGYPETRRVLREQVVSQIRVDDPGADPAEVALLRREGWQSLVMLPLVARGETIGLVELEATGSVVLDERALELVTTMANEAAMVLENAQLYADARRLADRDPLTDCYNHRAFHQRLGEEILRAGRGRRPLALLMLDLDGFKLVNDTLGHPFGDRVLAWVASVVRGALRGSDVLARYGGDEFAVILPDADRAAAERTAERIATALAERPFVSDGGPVPVGVSIGIATYPTDGRTGAELIAAADAALYAWKRARAENRAERRRVGRKAAVG